MSDTTSIVFTGDIGFDKYMTNKWTDAALLDADILDFCHSADHVCANVEAAVYRAPDDPTRSAFFHAMDPDATAVFARMGTDSWTLANNHVMDAGTEGLESTLAIAASQGVRTFGAGRDLAEASAPLYLDEAGGIGIIGVGYMDGCPPATADGAGVFPWNAMDVIAERIAEIKRRCRWCVVVAHGGEEFASMPLPYTRDRYKAYLEFGADVVVGHHPHVPENYELFDDGKAIFYSLGNFIFDTDYQRAHPYTDQGVLLKLNFTTDNWDFEALGTRIDRETERIKADDLPLIFENVPADEYARLGPWGAKAFLVEDMKKMVFLHPEQYTDATSKQWHDYFFSTDPDGYYAGEHMDLALVVPYAHTATDDAWKSSTLERVKEHIWHQL